ncbi:MAG: acylphosphatase [Deltaproteobacteria bacterium]|nr:acylphosphatase [Deltaproteobacteria bacterium]
MDEQRLHLKISGLVQGVWFRASTRDQARPLGLTGWVRNLPDGRVEAVFEGPEPALKQILAWCRQGPPGSRVDQVETAWSPASGEFSGFRVTY